MSEYTLYSYWRSSCSARLRIAFNIKGIEYDLVSVNLLKDEQISDDHKALNPSGSVPLLVRQIGTDHPLKIGQSVAALEYLDEVHPDVAMLPPASDPQGRATVRVLANIVACDVQPVTNLRIMRRVRALGGNAEQWNKELMMDGLTAYESVASTCAGKYSFGNLVTIADACLLPAVWNANRFGIDMTKFPTISKVVENLEQVPAVMKASYPRQPDTPEEFKFK